jgi:hypothetical protein
METPNEIVTAGLVSRTIALVLASAVTPDPS